MKAYGKAAGDARYDIRGTATARLAGLEADFQAKSGAYRMSAFLTLQEVKEVLAVPQITRRRNEK